MSQLPLAIFELKSLCVNTTTLEGAAASSADTKKHTANKTAIQDANFIF
jgi:hypothetical protein